MTALGILLHGMMIIFFPITFFGIGMAATYLLYVDFPSGLLRRLGLDNIADEEAKVDTASATMAAPCTVPQLSVIVFLWVMQFMLLFGDKTTAAGQFNALLCRCLGICRHPVYINGHFSVKEPILRFQVLSGNQTYWLPSFDEKGYPEVSNRYFCMVNVKLRVSASNRMREDVVVRYIKGHLARLQLKEGVVMVFGKDVYVPLAIDFSAPQRIENRAWKLVARAIIKGGNVDLLWVNP
jgi:hypothetical protein